MQTSVTVQSSSYYTQLPDEEDQRRSGRLRRGAFCSCKGPLAFTGRPRRGDDSEGNGSDRLELLRWPLRRGMTECHGTDCGMSLRVRLPRRLVDTRARCALSKYNLVKTLSLRPPARRAVVPGSQPCMLRPLLHQHERSVVRLGACGIGYFAPTSMACDLTV